MLTGEAHDVELINQASSVLAGNQQIVLVLTREQARLLETQCPIARELW